MSAIYSASVDESATLDCSLLDHEIAELEGAACLIEIVQMKAPVLGLVFLSPAQLVSLKTNGVGALPWLYGPKYRPWFLVLLIYYSSDLTVFIY